MIDRTYPRHLAASLALSAALALPFTGLSGQQVSLPLGSKAPDAALEDLEGNPVQILDYVVEGKPTVIEFWASWCENCEALQPQLDRIHEQWESKVNVVAIAVAVSQTRRRVKRHVEDRGTPYPYLWDGEGEAVKAFEVSATSIVVILDGKGTVAYTGAGRNQDLVDEVAKLIQG